MSFSLKRMSRITEQQRLARRARIKKKNDCKMSYILVINSRMAKGTRIAKRSSIAKKPRAKSSRIRSN